MRAILIDPAARTVSEVDVPMQSDFMARVAVLVRSGALALDSSPPATAMFLDAIGFLREAQSFWRIAGTEQNVAGVGLIFGLSADGKLAPAPDAVTVEGVLSKLAWLDVAELRATETLEIVDMPGGKAPRVRRELQWRGVVEVAAVAATPPAAPDGLYAPAPAVPATPVAAAPLAPPVASPAASPDMAPIWVIRETKDNRYQVVEYDVTATGLGDVLSLTTVPNLDAARERIPAGLTHRPAADDVADDTLVETWS